MSKGGRYSRQAKQRAEKKTGKKGMGKKIALAVVLVLVVAIGIGAAFLVRFYNEALGKLNYVEVETQDHGKSYDDIMAEIYGNAGGSSTEGSMPDWMMPEGSQPEDSTGE